MLNKIKTQITAMLNTLEEAINYISEVKDVSKTVEMRKDIILFLDAIDRHCVTESLEIVYISDELRNHLDKHDQPNAKKLLKKLFNKYNNAVKIIPVKYKAVFLPNYENTWDSLESVYEAFNSNPDFITEIVIVPLSRNTPSGFKHVYNDYLTPIGVPNTHYSNYSFEADKPDFVFYNNPYDGINYDEFSFAAIRPHAGTMIYVPYYLYKHSYIQKEFQKAYMETCTELPGHNYADLIITQGESFHKDFEKKSSNSRKMVMLGNPKVDYIVNHREEGNWRHYPEWEKIIDGKTVFLLNTHYTLLAEDTHHYGINYLFKRIIETPDFALIWRPHPQSFLMTEQGENEGIKDFKQWLNYADNCDRIIIDKTEDALPAIMYSNGMFSHQSSIIPQWLIANDKPAFILTLDLRRYISGDPWFREDGKETVVSVDENALDLFDCFYEYVPKCLNEQERKDWLDSRRKICCAYTDAFIEDVKNKTDNYGKLRSKYKEQNFAFTDGNCGRRILDYIKKSIS